MDTMQVLSPAVLAGIPLRNRFVRSATYEGMATPDGLVSPELITALRSLAEGQVGLIISGHAFVSPPGRAGANQLAIDREGCLLGLGDLAAAVHVAGGKLAIQLAHAGGVAAVDDPAGPSPFSSSRTEKTCRAMTADEIAVAVNAFADAADRARRAGCDAVQIHAAHGYMISQFLSPFFNRRRDEYGGSLENRARILLAILDAIRARVGPDYPVMIKINSQDFVTDGFTVNEMLTVAGWLEAHGISAIEVSGGLLTSTDNTGPSRKGDPKPDAEACFHMAAIRLKRVVKVPVILVGSIRRPETAEQLLRSCTADFFAMCRPFIREPNLIARWTSGDHSRATCISCNLCFVPVLRRERVYCLAAERKNRLSKTR